MLGYGDPLQYSVFRCDLSPKEKVLMLVKLKEIIHHRGDWIMIIDLGPADGRGERCFEFLGQGTTLTLACTTTIFDKFTSSAPVSSQTL